MATGNADPGTAAAAVRVAWWRDQRLDTEAPRRHGIGWSSPDGHRGWRIERPGRWQLLSHDNTSTESDVGYAATATLVGPVSPDDAMRLVRRRSDPGLGEVGGPKPAFRLVEVSGPAGSGRTTLLRRCGRTAHATSLPLSSRRQPGRRTGFPSPARTWTRCCRTGRPRRRSPIPRARRDPVPPAVAVPDVEALQLARDRHRRPRRVDAASTKGCSEGAATGRVSSRVATEGRRLNEGLLPKEQRLGLSSAASD